MEYNKLRGYFAENRIPLHSVAEIIGVTPSSLTQKLNGKEGFTVPQVQQICLHYGISADRYFFDNKVS